MLPKRKEMRPMQQARARQVVSGSHGGGQVEKEGSERVKAMEGWEARAAAIGIYLNETRLSRGWWHPKLKRGIFIFKFDFFTSLDAMREHVGTAK